MKPWRCVMYSNNARWPYFFTVFCLSPNVTYPKLPVEKVLHKLPRLSWIEHRSETFDENSFNEWVDMAEAPALPASLKLYKEVQQMGFTIFLLTGRDESQRNATVKNLLFAGYSNWERLILRYAENLMMETTSFYYFRNSLSFNDDGNYLLHLHFCFFPLLGGVV